MRRGVWMFMGAYLLAGLILACSSTAPSPLETFLRNLNAAQCDNQPATLANLPLAFVTPAQAAQVLAAGCAALFGTAPAPTPAPGNISVIPGAK